MKNRQATTVRRMSADCSQCLRPSPMEMILRGERDAVMVPLQSGPGTMSFDVSKISEMGGNLSLFVFTQGRLS